MKRVALAVLVLLLGAVALDAHDPSAAPITWNREISRIVYERCASCHRDGGGSFSLMTFQDAQPYASAIKDSVLARRMPPWGAVKGFGNFRNDEGLTQEQIALVADWVEGGITRGNNPRSLPPRGIHDVRALRGAPGAIAVAGGWRSGVRR
jgi:mono/diheme cytochrome c family protein